MVIMRMLPVFP